MSQCQPLHPRSPGLIAAPIHERHTIAPLKKSRSGGWPSTIPETRMNAGFLS
jgi:hypothetical protein